MTQIHTCYKVSKMLKEFLGESAPEPMADNTGHGRWWYERDNANLYVFKDDGYISYPAYQLQDLLSRPFCEAFVRERFARGLNYEAAAWELTGLIERIVNEYYSKGLPAVEAALVEMMEGK